MAFKPNYNRDRAERDRAARARSAEKLARKQEKSAQRKALRDGTTSEQEAGQDTGNIAADVAEHAQATDDKPTDDKANG
jgi:hypothetical protein